MYQREWIDGAVEIELVIQATVKASNVRDVATRATPPNTATKMLRSFEIFQAVGGVMEV